MKEIKIDIEKLARMPEADIDDKGISQLSLLDALFGYQSYGFERNKALGFIVGEPTYAKCSENKVRIYCVNSYVSHFRLINIAGWRRQIVEHLTGITNIDAEGTHIDILCEDVGLVYSFCFAPRCVFLSLRHYDESLIQ